MRELIEASIDLVSYLIILVAGLALLAFLWGLMKFIFRVGGDEKAVDEGKRLIIWGLIALFVMTSVWGIIRWFQRDLGLSQDSLLLPGGRILNHSDIPDPGPGFPDKNA